MSTSDIQSYAEFLEQAGLKGSAFGDEADFAINSSGAGSMPFFVRMC